MATYQWADAARRAVKSSDGRCIPADPMNCDYAELLAKKIDISAYQPPPVTPADVKGEARRRILARYPDWKQANMTARGVELLNTYRLNASWTVEEQAEVDALQAAWNWVKSVRAASNTLEAIKPIPLDYTDNKRWPT